MIAGLFILLAYLFFVAATIALFVSNYLMNVLGVTSFSQIAYNLDFGVEGSSSQVWQAGIDAYFESYGTMITIVGFLALILIAYIILTRQEDQLGIKISRFFHFNEKRPKLIQSSVALATALCLLSGFTFYDSAVFALDQVGYFEFADKQKTDSKFYETYYVKPDTKLLSSSKPKNLIILWVESLETSLASKKSGGDSQTSRIPWLEQTALANTNFAKKGSVGGASVTPGASWTIAGIMAETGGVPLAYGGDQTIYNWDEDISFIPGAVTLGDMLDQFGYQNYFRCGSQAAYAGRANYFKQHGNFEIRDYEYSVQNGQLPAGYWNWWGYEDHKLFDFAKEDLSEISASGKPFCYTMLTADSHFPEGLWCEDCVDEFGSQMENVFACTDRHIQNFIEWAQGQPWYANTTILITGDHCSMDEGLGMLHQNYDRKVFFTYLNAPQAENTEREITTFDLFPTTLAAMGYQIEGDRLGLGTNLYSDRETICEEIGFDKLFEEMESSSEYYQREIQGISDSDMPLTADQKEAKDKKKQKEEEKAQAKLLQDKRVLEAQMIPELPIEQAAPEAGQPAEQPAEVSNPEPEPALAAPVQEYVPVQEPLYSQDQLYASSDELYYY